MKRSPRLPSVIAVCGLFVGLAAGSTLWAAEPEPTTSRADLDANPIVAPRPPAPVSSPAPRAISPATAALLASVAPPYSPPPAGSAETNPVVSTGTRGPDEPRNTIIRLPSYVVQGTKLPPMKERQLLTPKGRLELAYKTHPGLKIGSLPWLNNDFWAGEMLAEDQRAERAAEMADLVSLLPTGKSDLSPALQRKVQEAFIRPLETVPTSKPELQRGLMPFEKR